MNERIAAKVKLLPDSPGVYRMMDALGEIIYVGKAKNLKNRVRQYFQSGNSHPPKVAAMVTHIDDFDYVLTLSEAEALTLESNLIKQYRPRYNILLKDDKHFPYVRVDMKRRFGQVEVVRAIKKDGAKYIGPYLSSAALRDAINVVREFFPIRHCKKDIDAAIAQKARPCLMYHVGKCCAPCSGNVTPERYHELLIQVCAFLDGNQNEVIDALTTRMKDASDNLFFERAAKIRDKLQAIKSLNITQHTIIPSDEERDVFALAINGDETVVFALFVRSGKVIGTQKYEMLAHGDDASDIMSSFLKQHYDSYQTAPKEIAVLDMPNDVEQISAWLGKLSGHPVKIFTPMRGDKLQQLKMAYENGVDVLKKNEDLLDRTRARTLGAAAELGVIIGMASVPVRMECYDNSHIQGTDTVGAMVVFVNGDKVPTEYRRFQIKSAARGDDCAAMEEMLTRRFTRAKMNDSKFKVLPDLLIVDGGRAQLNVALRVLEKLGFSDIQVIALAEKNEEIIVPLESEPIILERRSNPLQLVERIRDEAHRFAITYHRSLRSSNALHSVLEDIPGIGVKRRRKLFNAFISIESIKNADEASLCEIIGKKCASEVYNFFHNEGENK